MTKTWARDTPSRGARGRNVYTLRDDGVVEILVKDGHVILIDSSDLDVAQLYSWHATKPSPANRSFYASTNFAGSKKWMHRVLFKAEHGVQVDHRNGNGLDNRRSNLRAASQSQNKKNLPAYANNKSGYKGVIRLTTGRYRASIGVDGKRVYLGTYDDAETAAIAYNVAATNLHGEFARLNVVS
jgi:hypothetical protein